MTLESVPNMISKPILTALLLLIAPCALPTHKAWSESKDVVNQAQPKGSGEGWVLKTDEEMFPLAGSSGEHFHQARAKLLNGSLESAQQEIRQGTAYLLLEFSRATEKGKKLLQASIRELQHLTEVFGKGESDYYELQNTGFEQIFGKSGLALANHHRLKAEEAWSQNKPKATGQHLNAAILHMRHAWAWLGENFKAGARRVMKEEGRAGLVLTREELIQTDATAQALVKGTGWTSESVRSGLENIGKEIEVLRKDLEKQQGKGKRQ